MTRTTDVAVLEPKSDYNGDGVMNRYDDDLMRNDIKNGARADVAVHVHNNGNSDATITGHRYLHPGVPQRGLRSHVISRQEWSPSSSPCCRPYTSPQFVPVN